MTSRPNISANVIVDDLGFPGGAMFTTDSFTSAVQSFAQDKPLHPPGHGRRQWTALAFWKVTWTPMGGEQPPATASSYTQAQDFGGSTPYLHIQAN